MNTNTDDEYDGSEIHEMDGLRIGLCEEHSYWVSAGPITAALSESEFRALQGNQAKQIALIEEVAGVRIELIVEFERQEGAVRCRAETKGGHRCKQFAKGRWRYDFPGWLLARNTEVGPYCHTHLHRTMNVEDAC